MIKIPEWDNSLIRCASMSSRLQSENIVVRIIFLSVVYIELCEIFPSIIVTRVSTVPDLNLVIVFFDF